MWETDSTRVGLPQSDLMADYASAWQAADKVVYSSTVTAPPTANSARTPFRPIRELKAAAGRDLLVGGPTLAAQALVAGLVDELALFVWPVVLGGRNPAADRHARRSELIDSTGSAAASSTSATAFSNDAGNAAARDTAPHRRSGRVSARAHLSQNARPDMPPMAAAGLAQCAVLGQCRFTARLRNSTPTSAIGGQLYFPRRTSVWEPSES